MNHSNILDEVDLKSSSKRVFTKRMVELGAFFGGPLTAGYLLANNYKALGEKDKVGITYAMAVLGMLVYTGTALIIKLYVYDFPNTLLGVLSWWATRVVYQKEQAVQVEQHLAAGGEQHSGWQVFKVIMVVLVLMLSLIFGGLFLYAGQNIGPDSTPREVPSEPIQPLEMEESTTGLITSMYGGNDHMITYNREEFSGLEIDRLAATLMNIGYFGRNRQRVVYVELQEENYTFFMVEQPQLATNPTIQEQYILVKNALVAFYETVAVDLILTDEAWEEEYVQF